MRDNAWFHTRKAKNTFDHDFTWVLTCDYSRIWRISIRHEKTESNSRTTRRPGTGTDRRYLCAGKPGDGGRVRRSGLPWPDGQAVVDWIAPGTCFHRHLEVLLHHSLPTPVTCGIFRPAIVLPCDAQNWDSEDLKRAITHESEHVRRGDWVTQCFARAVWVAYWFHPLVWIAWRRLSLEAERACDDAVLRRSEATAYADQLV